MNLINKIIMLGLMAITILAFNTRAYGANGDYALSCKNELYGIHHGSNYVQAQNDTTQSFAAYGVYAGTDCAYAGASKTNSSAIVGGEIARAAANAVVGAVNSRLASALRMNNTAAHMSYTADGTGIGMAANHIVGGLSIWTNFSNSTFENDQTYTDPQGDSNAFDGDHSAVTVGIDKQFGNVVVGVAMTGFDTDIDIDVNKGDIQAEGETFGVYVGLNTGALNMSFGAGTGEYEIDTRRTDMGSSANITASDITADVTYYHLNVSGTVSRGKLSFSPRVGYRNFDLDMPAFTDVIPDDVNTLLTTSRSTDDDTISGKTYSSDMTEAGLTVALSAGAKLIPYIDLAYVNEDTTGAAYQTEATADAASADLDASNPDGYMTYGGGLILNLSGRVSGYLAVSETTARDDFSETNISGSLKIKF